jgi:hypothetical protein
MYLKVKLVTFIVFITMLLINFFLFFRLKNYVDKMTLFKDTSFESNTIL